MPYITPERRKALKEWDHPRTAGELNWLITDAIVAYVKAQGMSYQTINDVKGVLTAAKDEFGRRIADRYEDVKIIDNGDVYGELVEMIPAIPISFITPSITFKQ